MARDDTVLVVVDVQIDFCPGGALAVQGGHEIVPSINALIEGFDHVILTQDWHPPEHSSFASSHLGRSPFATVDFPYGAQTLWPDHCVQGTVGADFHEDLVWTKAQLVIRKGYHQGIDSYSAFFENDRKTPTGLNGYLRERGMSRVILAGLATDYCVAYSALDAARLGFDATVVLDACRGIDLNGSLVAAQDQMKQAGVALVTSSNL